MDLIELESSTESRKLSEEQSWETHFGYWFMQKRVKGFEMIVKSVWENSPVQLPDNAVKPQAAQRGLTVRLPKVKVMSPPPAKRAPLAWWHCAQDLAPGLQWHVQQWRKALGMCQNGLMRRASESTWQELLVDWRWKGLHSIWCLGSITRESWQLRLFIHSNNCAELPLATVQAMSCVLGLQRWNKTLFLH